MKQKIVFLILTIPFLFACSPMQKEGKDGQTPPPRVISKITATDEVVYLEVDGVPFPLYGAQIRLDAFMNCDKMHIDDVEKYFAKAKDLNLNCLQIPIWWNAVEPEEDRYDYTYIDKMMAFANKYDLKIELLWFSTNMIGDSFSYLVPTYILNKPEKRLYRNDEGSFFSYYGYQYILKLNDPWILERETRAVTKLFNHIRVWDMENEDKHPVITAQIHNEPDGLVRWRMDQKQYAHLDGRSLNKEEAWQMTLEALNEIGKAVQNSSYKVATRTNLIFGKGIEPFPEATNARPLDVLQLEGIDFISVDPYKETLKDLYKEVAGYASLEGNYPLVAENKGVYPNTPGMILLSSALGAGYDIYDLSTSLFFINNTSPSFADQIDHGIYTWDLKEKTHTPPTRKILKGLTMAAPEVALTATDNFAAFNIQTDYPQMQQKQYIQTTGAGISFETHKGAIGFVLDRGSYLLCYATEEAEFTFNNGTVSEIETGRYDKKGVFETESKNLPTNSKLLKAVGGVLYRIDFRSDGELNSTVLDNIAH